MRPDLIQRFQDMMEEEDIPAFAVVESSNLEYFTGIDDLSGVLVLTQEDRIMAVPKFFRYSFQEVSGARVYTDSEDRKETLESIFKDLGIDSILSDREGELSGIDMEKSGLVEKARIRKTDKEVDKLKKAAKLGDRAFEHLFDRFKPGMSEWKLASEVEQFFRRNNAYNSFDPLVHFNTVEPHRNPDERTADRSDLVLADIGCKLNGYCSDMTRMIPNDTSGDREELIEAVSDLQRRCLERVEPGAEISSMAGFARDRAEELGFSVEKNYLHSLGHGVGVDIHEQPSVSVNSERALEPGMVITVEPGLYVPETGGVRIEDTVVVREEGFERLTLQKRIYER
ncbi:MAG: Xaa-Pro peptidase family protein [Candidatus Nanohaloarchaea archaeon]|nr:Xaa-Pro peptidase family protein [Candidatus Nanohaloarchaea archaeon]